MTMSTFGILLLLLLSCTLITTMSVGMVDPYYSVSSHTLNDFDLTQLDGHWYSVYNRSPINGVCPQLNIKVGDGSVNVVESLGNNTVFNEKLVPNSYLKGKLEKLVSMGTWTAALPWYVLQVDPLLVVYKVVTFEKNEDQWSIYSRTPNPSADSVAKSVQKLVDVGAVNANGEPGYHCDQ